MNISPEIISLIDKIKSDKAHGASQLARQAIAVLKIAAECSQADNAGDFLREQEEIGNRLMSARPTMAPIFNIVSPLLRDISKKAVGMDLDTIRQLTVSKADKAISHSLQVVAQIAKHSSGLIVDGDRIMTHSYSLTVVAVLREAFTEHAGIEVITTRSGPGRTGEEIARQLGDCGGPITFIDDAAVGLYLSTASKVMLGADRVCADGKVVNGIGSYQLALAAERAGIPLYILCDTLKFNPRLSSEEVDLEEREPSEVVEPTRLPPGVSIKNPHFDITPLELITGIVTERGLLAPAAVISYLQELHNL